MPDVHLYMNDSHGCIPLQVDYICDAPVKIYHTMPRMQKLQHHEPSHEPSHGNVIQGKELQVSVPNNLGFFRR